MSSYLLNGLLKFIAYALGYLAMIGAMIGALALLRVLFGNVDADQEKAAYYAVLDYASNKVIALPSGNPDRDMRGKPFESESCPSGRRVWGLLWVRVHPCWVVEYPTTFNTYRWFVDLRDSQKVRRRGLDHGKPVWVEVYEYHVKRLPPFDTFYPQSEDWNR